MENTYTYTARSALAPEKVVTFTLYDHHMAVDVGAPLEHVERALRDVGEETEAETEAEAGPEVQEEAKRAYALKPTAVSLMERGGRPFNIADVYAQAKEDALIVTAWVRAKGLRLLPVRFAWEQVDNPQAAQAFSQEVRVRSQETSPPGRFRGVMDYWASWLLLGILFLALFWPRGGRENQETEGE